MTTALQRSRQIDTDRSATWKLWHWNFTCQTVQLFETPDWVFTEMGVASSGDAAIDARLMNNLIPVQLNAAEIAIRISKGYPVVITNTEDAVILYELVSQHINNWTLLIESGRAGKNIPYNQLLAFDKLASICWKVARPFFPDQIGTSHLITKLNSLMFGFKDQRKAATERLDLQEDHTSVASIINKAMIRTERKWSK